MPQPSPNPPRKLVLERKPWGAWQRDLTRLYGLLGFKSLVIALAVVLGAALWLQGSNQRLTSLSKKQSSLQRELVQMKALVALRKKIDESLANAQAQMLTEQGRGVLAVSPEVAAANWQTELQAQLSGFQVSDVRLTLAEPEKSPPFGPVISYTAEFAAVPEQLVRLIQGLTSANRLVRITELQLDINREQEWPRLKVRMSLEALYFQPEGKPGKSRASVPATPAVARPVSPPPPPPSSLPPGKPGFP